MSETDLLSSNAATPSIFRIKIPNNDSNNNGNDPSNNVKSFKISTVEEDPRSQPQSRSPLPSGVPTVGDNAFSSPHASLGVGAGGMSGAMNNPLYICAGDLVSLSVEFDPNFLLTSEQHPGEDESKL